MQAVSLIIIQSGLWFCSRRHAQDGKVTEDTEIEKQQEIIIKTKLKSLIQTLMISIPQGKRMMVEPQSKGNLD